jgi:hypothetical protein
MTDYLLYVQPLVNSYCYTTGAVVPIPAGVHTVTVCAVGGGLNVDYLKFKVSSVSAGSAALTADHRAPILNVVHSNLAHVPL